MKTAALLACCLAAFGARAQMNLPELSPLGITEQKVGITTVSVDYSRPSKKGRRVFPDVVPYGKTWRTGANKSTVLKTDRPIEIQQQTLPAGEYALYTIPERDHWTVIFYKDTEHWGVPKKLDDGWVALKARAHVKEVRDVETFTISIDDVSLTGASLVLAWDNVSASVPFSVLDAEVTEKSIRKTLAGKPSAADYYRAADHYVNIGGDMQQALEWIGRAIKMGGEKNPNWYWMRKAQILANLGDYEQAIEAAQASLQKAKEAGDGFNVRVAEESIRKWRKKGMEPTSKTGKMENAEFFVTPGYGERQLRMHGYSQAVKIGNRVETSGQGGWNDNWEFPESLRDEIAQAFANLTRTLETAGATWENVISVHSYHVGFQEEVNEMMTENFRKHMPNHAPIWTLLGVDKLGDPKMRVEIRVVAVL